MGAPGHVEGEGRGPRELRELLPVLDVDEPIVVRFRHEPGPAAARLLVSLGAGWVVDADAEPCVRRCGREECRVTVVPVISAHDAFASASCVEQGCPFEAEPYSDRCRDHAPRRGADKRTAKWTRESIIEAIRSWQAIHGCPPTSKEWTRTEASHPAANLVVRVFGSWADAVEAAGFERPVRGRSAKPETRRGVRSAVEERDPKAEEHPLDEAAPTSTEATGAASATPGGRSPSRSSTADLAAFAVALIVGLRDLADALEDSLSPSRNGFSDLSEPGATS